MAVGYRISLDGFEYTVGPGRDLSWDDIESLQGQADRWSMTVAPVLKLSSSHVKALVSVMRTFEGAHVQSLREIEHEAGVQKHPKSDWGNEWWRKKK